MCHSGGRMGPHLAFRTGVVTSCVPHPYYNPEDARLGFCLQTYRFRLGKIQDLQPIATESISSTFVATSSFAPAYR